MRSLGMVSDWCAWGQSWRKKGDHVLFPETPFQSVASYPRRHGVMFSPSSSRSRLHIVDGGRRYEVRLTDHGTVQYSLGGAHWLPIEPRSDLAPARLQTPSSVMTICAAANRSLRWPST